MLHLFEGVHMYLFIAMVLNFCTNAYLVYRVVHWQVLLASYEHEGLAEAHPEIDAFNCRPPNIFSEGSGDDESSKAKFKQLEKYFLEVTGRDDDGKVILGKGGDGGDFEFSRYLSLCLDQIMTDVINFSNYTWVLVLILNTITAICADTIEYKTYGGDDGGSRRGAAPGGSLTGVNGIAIQQAVIGGLVIVVAYGILTMTQREISHMRQCTKDPNFSYKDINEEGHFSSVSLEHYCSNTLQALMFNVCYSVAKHVANKHWWMEYSGETGQVILFVFYIVLFLFTAIILFPECVFTATIALALPPHVDEQNMATALACQADAGKRKTAGISHGDHAPSFVDNQASQLHKTGPGVPGEAVAVEMEAVSVEVDEPKSDFASREAELLATMDEPKGAE